MTELTTGQQADNYGLISGIFYKLMLHTKSDTVPDEMQVETIPCMCAADLMVGEGKETLFVLDGNSSRGFEPSKEREEAIARLVERYRDDGGELKVLEAKVGICHNWAWYVGVGERSEEPYTSERPEQTATRCADSRLHDSLDTRPYMLIGTAESFGEREIQADEVKVVLLKTDADRLFGYRKTGQEEKREVYELDTAALVGLSPDEIQEYAEKRSNLEVVGQAFCRQTSAYTYGTHEDSEPGSFNCAQMCNGARMRTDIEKEAGVVSTSLERETLFHLSFSAARFEQLFGSLDGLLAGGSQTEPTILNNVSMEY